MAGTSALHYPPAVSPLPGELISVNDNGNNNDNNNDVLFPQDLLVLEEQEVWDGSRLFSQSALAYRMICLCFF